MAIFTKPITGLVGVNPGLCFLDARGNSYAEITTAGFLNKIALVNPPTQNDYVLAVYNVNSVQTFTVSIATVTGLITLNPTNTGGQSGTANHIACFGTEGNLTEDPATAISAGNIQAGVSGTDGSFISFPPTASKGTLRVTAQDNTGDTDTVISNRAMGQASTVFIPDPGTSSSNFLLDEGANNLLAMQQMINLADVKFTGAGAANWTYTRIAQGNYAWVHTVGADTTIIAMDLTPYIRTAADKGFRLDSFDVIYFIGAAAIPLVNSITLARTNYVNNAAVSVSSIALTGSLPFAAQANPYVANIAVTTPAFDNTSTSKYVVEHTVTTDTTTIFSFYGMNLRFTQTIG